MEKKIIDLRSDTVTKPTQEMREAMRNAEVGDDGFSEDPTVNQLEKMAAEKMGKEAAIYVVSGTMGNQVSLRAHTQPGDEIIVESQSHIYNYELGAMAALAGVQPRTIPGKYGILDPQAIEEVLQSPHPVCPPIRVISIESSHNRAGGTVYPLPIIKQIYKIAKKHSLMVHLDGARIFNAAIALGVKAKQIAQYADSIMFCLSKGLGAPVGSIIASTQEFIEKTRRFRRMYGGGWRQAGIIAAAGIVALEKMIDRLVEDHQNARILAEGINRLPGLKIDFFTVQTNIVVFEVADSDISAKWLMEKLREKGILISGFTPRVLRMVTHKDVDRKDIYQTLNILEEILRKK